MPRRKFAAQVASGADMSSIYSGAKALMRQPPGLSLVRKRGLPPAKRTGEVAGAMKIGKGKHGWAGVCAGNYHGRTTVTAARITAGRGSDFTAYGLYADIRRQDEAGRYVWRIRVG